MVSVPLELVQADAGSKQRLRLWIRLLRVVHVVEGELRERLKREFDTTLPRFDVMSALYRERDGMLMSDLSRFLLVSNGNVTGIVERLVADGLVQRSAREGDRRAFIVRLTEDGVARFAAMAAAHEEWIAELLGEVSETDAKALSAMLKAFRSNWEGEH
jgi:DNA-binding MarR family transcriptional regulator